MDNEIGHNLMKKVFLSAGWYNLVLFNFVTPQEILKPFLPHGAELDLFDNQAFVSLVAFQFHNTEVMGIKWPGFKNFPELNLRFYVRYKGERGVCFIKEYVPSQLITTIAKVLYNEPYKKAKMTDHVVVDPKKIVAEYTLKDGLDSCYLSVKAANEPYLPSVTSVEHFFKEHELGVGRDRRGRTLTYRVHHPHWKVYPIENYEIKLDAANLYGESFGYLAKDTPASVFLAEGSEILVYKKD